MNVNGKLNLYSKSQGGDRGDNLRRGKLPPLSRKIDFFFL